MGNKTKKRKDRKTAVGVMGGGLKRKEKEKFGGRRERNIISNV